MIPSMIKLLDLNWPGHPEVFIAGTQCQFKGASTLPATTPASSEWVPVFAHAISEIHKLGFQRVFLCLDDLHPLARCNGQFLSEVVPRWLEAHNAGYIYLLGWLDNGTLPIEGDAAGDFLRLSPKGSYYASLQVGYWNLSFLQAVTEGVVRRGGRNAWDWEKMGTEAARELGVPCYVLKNGSGAVDREGLEKSIPKEYWGWVTVGPYPYKKGGFADNGMIGRPHRRIYEALAGNIPEVKEMIARTRKLDYRLQNIRKWLVWKRKGINYRWQRLTSACKSF
jgi:hypothetical protein